MTIQFSPRHFRLIKKMEDALSRFFFGRYYFRDIKKERNFLFANLINGICLPYLPMIIFWKKYIPINMIYIFQRPNLYSIFLNFSQAQCSLYAMFLGSLMAKITILKDNGKTAPIVLFCIIISRFQTRKDVSTYIFFFLIRLQMKNLYDTCIACMIFLYSL